jgi:hypothetical protein
VLNLIKSVKTWGRTLKRSVLVVVLLSVVMGPALELMAVNTTETEPDHKKLTYDLAVNILSVPFVAVGKSGQPLFDLKQEELELYLNGRRTPISQMYGIAFKDDDVSGKDDNVSGKDDDVSGTNRLETPKKKKVKRDSRLMFLVIDSVFNGYLGLKYSKQIVKDMVKKAPPEDKFILLEITLNGLKYVTGPVPGGTNIAADLRKVEKNAQKLAKWIPTMNEKRSMASGSGKQGGTLAMNMISYLDGNRSADSLTVRMYTDAYKQLKRVLKMLDGPKQTFIFTEGFASYSGGREYTYRKTMETLSNYVYDGGSVLRRVWTKGMRPHQLKQYARGLNKSVSAYYEIFFRPGKKIGGNLKIEIKCKREGVRINAVGHKEREKPYWKMKTHQKKVFAISVVTGLSFSGISGRVYKAPYRILKSENANGERLVTLKVNMPEQLKNRKLDMYLLRFDDAYRDADVTVLPTHVKGGHEFTLQTLKEKRHLFFLFIDPRTTNTIFNKVI